MAEERFQIREDYDQRTASGLPWWFSGKEPTCQGGDVDWIPGLGRCPGEGNGNPLQYSCLENPMDRGASPWCCRVRHDLATKQQKEKSKKMQDWVLNWV